VRSNKSYRWATSAHFLQRPEDDRPRRLVFLQVDKQQEALDICLRDGRPGQIDSDCPPVLFSPHWKSRIGETLVKSWVLLSNRAGTCSVAIEDPGIAIEIHSRGDVEDAPNHR
jgi:hypothetical protein